MYGVQLMSARGTRATSGQVCPGAACGGRGPPVERLYGALADWIAELDELLHEAGVPGVVIA